MKRTIAIGDIHGRFDCLTSLVCKLKFTKDDTIIFLGDYIDRGPESKEVIDSIIYLQGKFKVVALKGNHEDLCLKAYSDEKNNADIWIYNGGGNTLKSYKNMKVSKKHLDWMRKLPLYFETERYIFVHAGLLPGKPLRDQNEHTLMWIRNDFIESDYDWSKVIVFGHTPTINPIVQNNKIGIDTCAFRTSRLTAVIFSKNEGLRYPKFVYSE